MDNYVAVVEEDPFCLGSTFAAERLDVEVISKTLFNRLSQRLDMGTRCPGCDHENVRENKLLFNIEKCDV
jgi:hypothetical protein